MLGMGRGIEDLTHVVVGELGLIAKLRLLNIETDDFKTRVEVHRKRQCVAKLSGQQAEPLFS